MKPKLIGEAELEALYDEENKGRCCVVREDFLAGARAVLKELNIQAVAEIPATRCSDHEKRVYCQYSDWDTGCELCSAMPEKGALLVREKKPPQG